MTSGNDLEALITSTLSAMETTDSGTKAAEPRAPQVADGGSVDESDENLDKILSEIESAAPKLTGVSSGSTDSNNELGKLLEGILTPESIIDSMGSLAVELDLYLSGKNGTDSETMRYRSQLQIYKEVSDAYKADPKILDSETAEGERIRTRLAELQSLGSPPPEVVQKLMLSQFPGTEEAGGFDIGEEFAKFVEETGSGGLLSGLSKEDEEVIKRLSRDPNELKNLLGSDKPGDCSIM